MADEIARAAMVPVDRIRMHPRNIRKTFTGLDELAASISYEGVLEPLLAHQKFRRAAGVQDLELIAGHRRLAAAEIAGLRRVPVFIVPTMRDDEAMLAMLAENTQRCAVPVRDLGRALTELHDEFGYDYSSIAERLGITLEELREWRQGRELRPPSLGAPASNRRTRRDAGQPARRPAPKVRPSAVHDLIVQFDAGQVDASAIVAELRGWLGDWTPKTSPPPAAEPEQEAS
jgi:ParB family chromosome partitioning protein